MNILVTGGSGFIGTRLIDELLRQSHQVKIYDKVLSLKYPDLSILADVRDKEKLISACKDIDVVYHLAAEHADDVRPISLYDEVNIGGAKNLVIATKKNDVKNIIFTSSVAIYGLNKVTPDESDDAEPFNEYGRTKFVAENIFINWSKERSDLGLTILRPSVIFGENNRGNVYNLINQVIRGKFLMVGDGKNKKSMGYVGNIVSFLASRTDQNTGVHIFNFADKPDLSSREIIQIIKQEKKLDRGFITVPYYIGLLGGYSFDFLSKITKKKYPISSIRIKKFCAETTINTNRLLHSGFKAPYTLEEGLRNMIKNDFENN